MGSGPILFFDGVCNLCNGTIQLLLKADKKEILRFGSLQSVPAGEILSEFSYDRGTLDSLILLEKGVLYTESTAILRTARLLGGIWWWPYCLFIWVPRPIRDWAYRKVAANRYRWFGKKDQCLLPSPRFRQRFLD